LLWATDTESDLREFAQRLRADDPEVFSHTENGVQSDRGRVMIGYPSPCQLPRTVVARRLRAQERPKRVASNKFHPAADSDGAAI
jgi:hypothetical protein